jgi:signal transduction histidine kinase
MATLGKIAATVSHELRNPLGTIRSSFFAINLCLEHQDEKVSASLNRAERSVARCDRIIDELLGLTRVQDLQLTDTPMDEWLANVLSDTPPPEGIEVESQLQAGLSVKIDRERLRQCLCNLLTNAYQAIDQSETTRNHGRVRVSTRTQNKSFEIHIADNGVGFDPKESEKLYEPLFSTKGFGVGLGMPIAKQIIEQHGGNIAIQGKPGQGATVVLRMPLKTMETP